MKDLLVGLRDRGLDMTRPILVVIDGGKALHAAVTAVFDHPVMARCQLHYVEPRIMWTSVRVGTVAAVGDAVAC